MCSRSFRHAMGVSARRWVWCLQLSCPLGCGYGWSRALSHIVSLVLIGRVEARCLAQPPLMRFNFGGCPLGRFPPGDIGEGSAARATARSCSRPGLSLVARGRWRLPAFGLVRGLATWLILPVVICLSQRLSHACLSISFYTAKLRMAH